MNHTESRRALTGEIIEIFETDKGRSAKVLLKSCHINVSVDAIPDAHLGDTVVLEMDLAVRKVKALSPNRK